MSKGKYQSIKKWKAPPELIERVHNYIRDGMRADEIKAMLVVEDEELNDFRFDQLLDEVYIVAEMALLKDRDYVFQLHMNRYEAIYAECIKLQDQYGIPLLMPNDYKIIRARYIAALMALKNKEDLLGLHDKSMVIEFNDQKAIVIDNEPKRGNPTIGYDFDKLSLEEMKELLEIIRSCRTVPIQGIERVVIKQTKIEINMGTLDRNQMQITKNIDNVQHVQDIIFEEMPPDVLSKVEDVTPPDDVIEVEKSIIEDLTGGLAEKAKPANHQIDAIQRNLLEELKKKMKK